MSSPVALGDVLLGKYRVERVLGQGGMGVVVAVRHIELGELFAMKFLLPAALAHADAVERFLREARASARLKGEHVVKVQDVGRLPDGLPYMVMEHLAGSDLKDVVRQRGPLPLAEAITYVLQACEALAEAHSLGIVHRDLKPANMFLIRRPNGSPCVKVLDFGISKQTEPENAEQHSLTRTGMVLGSPTYMSPEQMMRTKEADPRGDIWSMGVVLYQLLTGTVPFLADVLTELVGKVLQEDPLPPSHHRRDIPAEIDAVVMGCLQKRREQRFQTVNQLMDALSTALSGGALPLRASLPGVISSPAATPLPAMVPLQAGAPSGVIREASPSRPSELYLETATAKLPVANASVSSSGPGMAAITDTAMQTAQTWGSTANRIFAVRAPNRTAVVVGGAVALLMVGGVGAFVAWRYSDDSRETAAATSISATSTTAVGMTSTGVAASDTSTPTPATGPAAPVAIDTPAVSTEPVVSPSAKPTAKPPAGKPVATSATLPKATTEPTAAQAGPSPTPAAPAATSAIPATPGPTAKKHDSMY